MQKPPERRKPRAEPGAPLGPGAPQATVERVVADPRVQLDGSLRSPNGPAKPAFARLTRVAYWAPVLLAVLASGVYAWAAGRGSAVEDGRDPGLLDLRRLQAFRGGAGGQVLRIVITTWTRWRPELLTPGTPHRLVLSVDTDRDGKADYTGRVVFEKGQLSLFLRGSGSAFEPLPVERLEKRRVAVWIPGDSPPNPAGRKVWVAAESLYVAPGTLCRSGCLDRIPDSGWLQTP